MPSRAADAGVPAVALRRHAGALDHHPGDARHCSGLRSTGLRFVPQQFFPASDRPELLVDLKLPQNSSIYASETVASRLEGS